MTTDDPMPKDNGSSEHQDDLDGHDDSTFNPDDQAALDQVVRQFFRPVKTADSSYLSDEATSTSSSGDRLHIHRDLTGLTIGSFEFLERLGCGQFGNVYRVHNHAVDRIEAVKIPVRQLKQESREYKRFRREAFAAAKLNHPGIVGIHGAGELDDGTPFIEMEYCSGKSLDRLFREVEVLSQLSPHTVAKLMIAVSDAVHYAHRNGVVHRDLKPENIVLELLPDFPTEYERQLAVDLGWSHPAVPRVCDFGLSKQHGVNQLPIPSNYAAGSWAYMALEQLEGHTSPSIDIYALGVIFLELLVRKRQPAPDAMDLEHFHLRYEASCRQLDTGEVPAELKELCLRCLEVDPTKRVSSAGEVASVLRRFLGMDSHVIAAQEGSTSVWIRKRLAVLGASMLVSVVLTVIYWVTIGELPEFFRARTIAEDGLTSRTPQDVTTEQLVSFDKGPWKSHCIGILRDWGIFNIPELDEERLWQECLIDMDPLSNDRKATDDNYEVLFHFGRPTRVRPEQMHDYAVVGDWTGDGYDELGGVRVDGERLLWLLDTNRNQDIECQFALGTGNNFPVVGDFDRQGVSDVGFVEEFGEAMRWQIHARAQPYPGKLEVLVPSLSFVFGNAEDTPLTGDFNGDGIEDVAVVHTNERQEFEWQFHYGAEGDWKRSSTEPLSRDHVEILGREGTEEPIVGDWNGDGKVDLGVVKRATSAPPVKEWFVEPFDYTTCYNQWRLKTKPDAPPDVLFTYGFVQDQFIAGRFNRPPTLTATGTALSAHRTDNAEPRYVQWKLHDVDESPEVWRPDATRGGLRVELRRQGLADIIDRSSETEGKFIFGTGASGDYEITFTYKERSFPSVTSILPIHIGTPPKEPTPGTIAASQRSIRDSTR